MAIVQWDYFLANICKFQRLIFFFFLWGNLRFGGNASVLVTSKAKSMYYYVVIY